jgi:hypothetical protein
LKEYKKKKKKFNKHKKLKENKIKNLKNLKKRNGFILRTIYLSFREKLRKEKHRNR